MARRSPKKTRVLFVDAKNDTTSQIAEYYVRSIFGDTFEVYSAGPERDIIDCEIISAMYQMGDDMRRQTSKDFKDADHLPKDDGYDFVIYTHKATFDKWSPATPWKGKQILADLGAISDFSPTDDKELLDACQKLALRVRDWVKANMDEAKLTALVSA